MALAPDATQFMLTDARTKANYIIMTPDVTQLIIHSEAGHGRIDLTPESVVNAFENDNIETIITY